MEERRKSYENELRQEMIALRACIDALTSQSIVLDNTAKGQSLLLVEHGTMLKEHDKILVRGNGVPSMQETVRVLAKSMSEFLDQSKIDKEEARQLRNKLLLLGLGIAIPMVIGGIWEMVMFYATNLK